MTSADIKNEQPKARLPKFDENPYTILDPTQATAQFLGNVEPVRSYPEAHRQGKRLIKTASVIAGLGLSVWGTTEFGQKVLHNTEIVPGSTTTPAQVKK
jgi:hypothetical protein